MRQACFGSEVVEHHNNIVRNSFMGATVMPGQVEYARRVTKVTAEKLKVDTGACGFLRSHGGLGRDVNVVVLIMASRVRTPGVS